MKKFLVGGTILISTLGLAVAALPSKKRVERSALVSASPEHVFALVSSTEGFQTFNPYKDEEPNLVITPSGPARGVGAAFAFKGKDAEGTQTIVALEENKSVTMQIDLGSMGRPTQSFTLSPEGDKTRVIWATESEFGKNPMARVFGLFMDGYLGPVYERGLKNLDRAAQEPARSASN
jgi:carbon monoxide dehydrogenase subunit G